MPKQQIFYSSTLKEFAGNNFKFDENGKKFSKRVKNTEGKGENACYEQFLRIQCFQNTYTADKLNQGLVWERVKLVRGNKKVLLWTDLRKISLNSTDTVQTSCSTQGNG